MDYNEKLRLAKEALDSGHYDKETIEYIFPELKESDDERIRKELIEYLKERSHSGFNKEVRICNDGIAWLEKQGEQKSNEIHPIFRVGDYIKNKKTSDKVVIEQLDVESEVYYYTSYDGAAVNHSDFAFSKQDEWELIEQKVVEQNHIDKVEPKFKVGDWIINSKGTLRHIVDVDKTGYQTDNGWLTHDDYEKTYHLWTIQDAKDGDVLYTSSTASHEIFIFKGLSKEGNIECYCSYDSEDKYCDGEYHFIGKPTFMTHPATKEQRDLLFTKMREAGYEWDAEKKELKKIEQKLINLNTINIQKLVDVYRNTDEYDEDGNFKGKPVNCMVRAYEQGIMDILKIIKQKDVKFA